MKITQKEEDLIKMLSVAFLLSFSILLISIYKTRLEGYTFYEHFFYLPIILASFWWGKKGMWIAVILDFFIIFIAIFSNNGKELFSALIKSTLILIVSSLVGILSEEKTKALEKERQFRLKAAHYFFNPISIAEGFIEIAKDKTMENREELELAFNAIERIKKVVKNVVERGEIIE